MSGGGGCDGSPTTTPPASPHLCPCAHGQPPAPSPHHPAQLSSFRAQAPPPRLSPACDHPASSGHCVLPLTMSGRKLAGLLGLDCAIPATGKAVPVCSPELSSPSHAYPALRGQVLLFRRLRTPVTPSSGCCPPPRPRDAGACSLACRLGALSEPQFSHLQNGNRNPASPWMYRDGETGSTTPGTPQVATTWHPLAPTA